jgi:tRNA-specific 2-thiouridylase
MSGGVDSSVAAAILVQEGYDVIGVTMQIWPAVTATEERFSRTCCSLSAVEDARRVAAKLGIPHYVLNFKDVFEKTVIDNFIEEYRRGRTPNPCIRCNRFVKFDALLTKARTLGADRVATGHYARIAHDETVDRWLLKRGVDRSKDQAYVLYGMTQDQLTHTRMPLGNMAKDETRRLAAELGLSVAQKPDSQEICFVENRDYPAFLERAVPEVAQPGPILDTSGKVIGEHRGIALYTVGQRRRLGIAAGEPLYVVRIDPNRNAVIVGRERDLYARTLVATDLNLISITSLTEEIAVTGKIRYNMKDAPALVFPLAGNRAQITFETPQRAITPGQAVVLYDGENVVGGGTIDRVEIGS